MVVGLAYGLCLAFDGRRGDWLGPVMLGAYGVCYMAIAFAPCDPGCTGTVAVHEKAHILLGRMIIMLAFATPLVLFRQFARVAPWSREAASPFCSQWWAIRVPGRCARPCVSAGSNVCGSGVCWLG